MIASAIGPSRGDVHDRPERPDLALAEPQRGTRRRGRGQPQPAQVAVRLAAEVQPRDRLLADVAALLERHRAVVETGLLRDHGVVEVGAVARPAALDPADLVRGLRRGHRAGRDQGGGDGLGVLRGAEDVDAEVGRDQPYGRPADGRHAVGVLALRQLRRARDAPRLRPDERQQPGLERALVQLDVAAELEAPDHVEQLLQRRRARCRAAARRLCRGSAGRRASSPCGSGRPRSSPRRARAPRRRSSPGRGGTPSPRRPSARACRARSGRRSRSPPPSRRGRRRTCR